MQLHQTVVYLLLMAIAPAHLFPHRSSRHLNLEQPTESSGSTSAIKNAETGSMPSSLVSMDAQQQDIQDTHKGMAASRETLNSPTAAVVVTSADDYRKPAFAQHMKQFMENSNTVIVYVIEDDANSNSKRRVNAGKQSERNGRQTYPIVGLDVEPTTKPTTSSGTDFFSIIPIALDWRHTIATPFAAFYTPATAHSPLRIWAIGSVAKFPPFIEHFVQRIQAYYSVYKYEDLSRPGFPNSGSTDQVVRVSTSSKMPITVADAIDAATESKKDETTSAVPSTTTTTLATTTSTA